MMSTPKNKFKNKRIKKWDVDATGWCNFSNIFVLLDIRSYQPVYKDHECCCKEESMSSHTIINIATLQKALRLTSLDTFVVTNLFEPSIQKALNQTYPNQGFTLFTPQKGNENHEKTFT